MNALSVTLIFIGAYIGAQYRPTMSAGLAVAGFALGRLVHLKKIEQEKASPSGTLGVYSPIQEPTSLPGGWSSFRFEPPFGKYLRTGTR